jgi:hypothetical protein
MPAFSINQPTGRIADSPDAFSGALAHVIHKEDDKDAIIGQAWLVGQTQLVTCGHVVEPFLKEAGKLLVKFPATGHEYRIDSLKIHPRFNRQDDKLLCFDAAVLALRLKEPELSARPLPLSYDVELKAQQSLWTIRYPSHLGSISSSPDALVQSGHFLGHLRKEDNFHLLHDLALAPGDSGAAIFSEDGVVAIHCGDTGSIPGLNLPTTAIRLALWGDALRELGIQPPPSALLSQAPRHSPAMIICQALVVCLIVFFTASLSLLSVKAYLHDSQQKSSAK